MRADKVELFKLKKLPTTPIKNAVLFVVEDNQNVVQPYVTDINGVPIPFKSSPISGTNLSTDNTQVKLEVKSSNGSSAIIPKEDVEALELNASTVNNKTVETSVPTGALFTDTIYDDTAIRDLIDNIQPGEVEPEEVTWAELVSRANKKAGDKYNITDSKPGYTPPMGIVTLLSETTFIWVDADGFEITVNIE